MDSGEFLIRAVLLGASLGVPAYVIGQLVRSGRTINELALATVGAISGTAGALVFTLGTTSTIVVVIAVILVGSSGAYFCRLIPGVQSDTDKGDRDHCFP